MKEYILLQTFTILYLINYEEINPYIVSSFIII